MQVDLVAFHRPAAHEFGRVGLEVGQRRKRLDLAQQRRVNAGGAGHQLVVKEMRQAARCGHPAGALDLAGLRLALVVAVAFGFVVMVTGLGAPVGVDMRVKRPVGQIDAVQRVGQRGRLELVWRKPARAVPLAQAVAHLPFADFEGQQALRRDGFVGGFMRNDGGRAAKPAARGHLAADKHRDGAAALALHLALLIARLAAPAAPGGRVAQGRFEVLLHDARASGGAGVGTRGGACLGAGHDGAAVRAHERLLGGIPLQVAAAFGAGVFTESGGRDVDFSHAGTRQKHFWQSGRRCRSCAP